MSTVNGWLHLPNANNIGKFQAWDAIWLLRKLKQLNSSLCVGDISAVAERNKIVRQGKDLLRLHEGTCGEKAESMWLQLSRKEKSGYKNVA